ncbi:MAG: TIGR01440 family protein [Clostridia bacterium]|nr:TIGR01440 family protein [Clostridia bacterium]
MEYDGIFRQAQALIREFLEKAPQKEGSLFVIGCSSSEIAGETIGKGSDLNAAQAVLDAVLPVLREHKIFLAAQCCEHLNRALILERAAAEKFGLEPVMVVPQPKAGGSFATAFWHACADPVAVEYIRASAGWDIGGTLIGMHLKDVAVPVRLSQKTIGQATLLCAKTRPKYIGGERARYE